MVFVGNGGTLTFSMSVSLVEVQLHDYRKHACLIQHCIPSRVSDSANERINE